MWRSRATMTSFREQYQIIWIIGLIRTSAAEKTFSATCGWKSLSQLLSADPGSSN